MYLNLKDSDLKKYVYRTISYERLIELFESKENTLVKPKLWEDTFENFVLKAKLRVDDNKVVEYDVHDRIYGQCWTLEKSSDAMWRIYSPDKKSIRIRTTVENLLDSMSMSLIDTPKCFNSVGKVEYLSEKKLLDRAHETFGKRRSSKVWKIIQITLNQKKSV